MKLSRRLFLLSPLALVYKPSWGALSFPLPQGHFVPAKMPMHPVYPRPDSETQSHARHRWAHPDFRYEIPIGVQGGAWPFNYEIITGPSGATIGEYYGDPDYGVVKWTPANGDSGTTTFTVRVTDQELNTVDLTWTTTIDANQFVFVDANATSTGSGTFSDPLKTFSDWYKGDVNDSTYHNKIIVFRGGNYVGVGNATSGNFTLSATTKTPSLIGYPDETAIIDCSAGKFTGGMDDLFIAGLVFKNARTDVSNPRFFDTGSLWNRGTWFNVVFDTMGLGTANDDNPACIYLSRASDTLKRYNILVKNVSFENITANGGNGAFVDFYICNNVLVEGCAARNSNTSYGLWMKATQSFVTIRNNDLSDNVTGMAICLGYTQGETNGVLPHDHEVCWNNLRNSIAPDDLRNLFVMNNNWAGKHYNTYIYRNTFGVVRFRYPGTDPFETDSNVAVSTDVADWSDSTLVAEGIPNLIRSPTDLVLDRQGQLKGEYRQNHLGIVGHEASDKIKIPNKPTSPHIT